MADLLVDTDVFIDHLRGATALQVVGHRISYSVITRAELFAGRGSDEGRVGRLLAQFRELGIDTNIAMRAGRIARAGEVDLPDALIAATALEHGLELATRHIRDFTAIPGLRLHDPSSPRP